MPQRIKPSTDAACRARLDRLSADCHALPGYLGAEFHAPTAGRQTYLSVFRFATLADLQHFGASNLRARALKDVVPLVDDDAIWDRMTGLEFWFDPPPGTVVLRPSPHRMALLLLAVVFGLVLVLNLILGPCMTGWRLAQRLLLTVTLQVLLMTYVITPRLTRALAGFIYPTSVAS